VKSDTRNLEFDLIEYSLEKVTSDKSQYENHMLNKAKSNRETLRNGNWLDLGTSLRLEKGS